jgi:hypothetical protein
VFVRDLALTQNHAGAVRDGGDQEHRPVPLPDPHRTLPSIAAAGNNCHRWPMALSSSLERAFGPANGTPALARGVTLAAHTFACIS